MIIITGAAGFIGSCLISKLNEEGFYDLVLVDDFSNDVKNRNFEGKRFSKKIEREEFPEWLKKNQLLVDFVFHIGARTDTAEFDYEVLNKLNVEYTKSIWNCCVEYGLPLVYASSAATYGLGEQGYDDNEAAIPQLAPLNPYGVSKNEFDKWALTQKRKPYFWVGLKFFNVYGPNEYHKGRMASVIFHAHKQIKEKGSMNLFRSHNPKFKDGEQMRDFVYVKDVVNVCYWLMHHRNLSAGRQDNSGIYNLGSGKARTFLDLVKNTFTAMNKTADIGFIDTPEDIRDKYQYFTEANMNKLKGIGYPIPFHTLEEGIADYVGNYLASNKYY